MDASVAFKWFVQSPGTARALTVLENRTVLLAPDLIVIEVANAAWKLARSGEITPNHAGRVATSVAPVFGRLALAAELIDGAFAIASELDHPMYDCLYLRLAELESTRLLTADGRLIRRTQGTRWESFVERLEDLPEP